MAENNSQIENLHAFLVRSYVQHMNESMSFINQSLHTIRRQDVAYNQMINDTIRLMTTQRQQNPMAHNRQYNNNVNNNITTLNRQSRRSSTMYDSNLLTEIDPYRQYYSTTTRNNTNRNFYNNMRNFWTQLNNQPNKSVAFNLDFNNFQDVVVSPPTEEINNATHIIRYGNITQPQNQTCPISLSSFQDDTEVMRIRYCGHLFNPEDLQTWFEQNVRCPLCRYDIRNYNSNLQRLSETRRTSRDTTNTNNTNMNSNRYMRIRDYSDNSNNVYYSGNEDTTDVSANNYNTTHHNDDNENITNVVRNSDGSVIYSRNILSTNIDDLQSQLQSLFTDINSSLLYEPINNTISTRNDSSNNNISQD